MSNYKPIAFERVPESVCAAADLISRHAAENGWGDSWEFKNLTSRNLLEEEKKKSEKLLGMANRVIEVFNSKPTKSINERLSNTVSLYEALLELQIIVAELSVREKNKK